MRLWQTLKEKLNERDEKAKSVLLNDNSVEKLEDLYKKQKLLTQNGIIIEEISSTHFVNDSFYTDKKIMQNKDRKTLLTHWRIS